MTENWTVQIEDGTHSVAVEISKFTGKLKISWDGHPIEISIVWRILGDLRSFERNGHTLVLSVRGLSGHRR